MLQRPGQLNTQVLESGYGLGFDHGGDSDDQHT